jgi:hypothetical protein
MMLSFLLKTPAIPWAIALIGVLFLGVNSNLLNTTAAVIIAILITIASVVFTYRSVSGRTDNHTSTAIDDITRSLNRSPYQQTNWTIPHTTGCRCTFSTRIRPDCFIIWRLHHSDAIRFDEHNSGIPLSIMVVDGSRGVALVGASLINHSDTDKSTRKTFPFEPERYATTQEVVDYTRCLDEAIPTRLGDPA